MARRHDLSLLCLMLVGAAASSARAGDALQPPMSAPVDPAKAKSKELEKQRLIAKLQAEAPKLVDSRSASNPLEAPIFHRYDRP